MGIACDFCPRLAERHEALVFVAAPSGLAHICEECVALAVEAIEESKREVDDAPEGLPEPKTYGASPRADTPARAARPNEQQATRGGVNQEETP